MTISNTEYIGAALESIPSIGSKHRKMLKGDSFKEAVAGANRVKSSYDEFLEASELLHDLYMINKLEMKKHINQTDHS